MASEKSADPRNYRFRFSAFGVELEFEGDRQFVIDLIKEYAPQIGEISHKEVVSNAVSTPSANYSVTPSPAVADKMLSVREFIRALGIKKHTEYVLAFGYFLEKYLGVSSFTPADINSLYYEAKIDASNTSQMLIQNIKRGLVMEAKNSESGKKRYVLTSSGEKYIEQLVAADAPKS